MLTLSHITLQRGDKMLLNDASLTVYPGERVGLIGKNGTGKSSLFALLRGELAQEAGDIDLPKHWLIAHVAQETPALDTPALDYVLAGDTRLAALQAALKAAQEAHDDMAQARRHAELDEAGIWDAPARAAQLLSGLGFSPDAFHAPVKTFSGGWRMRLNLAQALMCPADLLLLDEPTNHLDLETVMWLEAHLNRLDCAQLIISHDQDFLNATTRRTVEFSAGKLQSYGGDYDFYREEKSRRLLAHSAAYARQQAHIEHLQDFIRRFKAKATKATQAQSRVKALAKLERLAPAHLDAEFSFEFPTPKALPDTLMRLENAEAGYGEHVVLRGLNARLEAGARIGLLGVNGSGKSTFIKLLAGELTPLSGSLWRSEKLRLGYFSQHQLDTLSADASPLWHVRKLSPDAREQDIRNFLGGFLFQGDAVTAPIAPLSGGEKARLALALLVWQAPNLLLLDEPTNHLDLDIRHALTVALQSFEGALMVVSHDRSLLEATTDEFWVIRSGELSMFEGDLDAYQRQRLEARPDSVSLDGKSVSRKDAKRLEAQKRQELSRLAKPWQQALARHEKVLHNLTQEQLSLQAWLTEEIHHTAPFKSAMQATLARLGQVEKELAQTEEDWLEASSALEALNQEFAQDSV